MKTKTVWCLFKKGKLFAIAADKKAADEIFDMETEIGNVVTMAEWGINP